MKLRGDLQVLPLPGERDCIIVDDISGRFARIKRTLWGQLRRQTSSDDIPVDRSIAQQAVHAGWTRARVTNREIGWSPLSIKIPIASMDRFAQSIVPYSDWAYSPKAMFLWIIAAILGVVMLIVRWEHWIGSVPSLTKYLASLSLWQIGATFVLTKAIHETGHAVACRRLGCRCGVAGVWLLCGIPCPYVDVTEVWRQPDPIRRAIVMAAGMMAEGVVCVLAIWVWVLADSADTRLAAMNVILICGVSTILFNANPLMRYDGYFILSDLLDSANLRVEAGQAWMRWLSTPWARWHRQTIRGCCLSVYHVASTTYRVFIFVAIAAMILAVADQWNLWRIATIVVALMTAMAVTRVGKGWWGMFRGNGKWSIVPRTRRRFLAAGSIVVLVAIPIVPIPRYRHVQGNLEAKEVVTIYLPGEGIVDGIHVRVGDQVLSGQLLANLSDRELELHLVSIAGQSNVLKHRSRSARLASLYGARSSRSSSPNSAPENQWEVLDEASLAAKRTQAELADRKKKLHIIAPADGIILGGDQRAKDANQANTILGNPAGEINYPGRLSPGVGEAADDRQPWCRIATSPALQVALPLDAADHEGIQVGCPVRLSVPGRSAMVLATTVRSVSPLRADSDEVTNDTKHTYQAIADIPEEFLTDLGELPRWDGAVCQAVLHLPSRALWRDWLDSMRQWVGM
ncbi:efflux RND transporter periplasmic adaptor subunit [Neorhodopirellula pilleata]|uniref:HlyD family secretion protein n=1 Tax=Neorhodopirellula pilleata TaxID=2714738 RepID=A0A5C5ZZZ7_9BACT|nr:efflux RND transporter periplasmic adaptor subunit [Neorhodopirellula pilleata]TWT93142.1 HlyD family secretion protein [Neorhodopirellula pilleata]